MTRYYTTLFFIVLPIALFAQFKEPPFWRDIKAFKKSDSISFPSPNQILFVGSSSFRLWADMQKDFSGYPIINRGFGGSSLKDLNNYFNEIIKPYHAKQIVIYCGDNDFANDETLPVDSVVNRVGDTDWKNSPSRQKSQHHLYLDQTESEPEKPGAKIYCRE